LSGGVDNVGPKTQETEGRNGNPLPDEGIGKDRIYSKIT
jgi:hypothetical protein